MEIREYQEKAKRTLVTLTSSLLDDIHMVFGMSTEVGEIEDVYKKHLAYGKNLDLVNVREEIGDLMWYIANMCNLYGWDLRDIMETNIKKLEARYPEKFTEDKALNRDLATERTILEGNTTRDIGFSNAIWTSENAFSSGTFSEEGRTTTFDKTQPDEEV